jgi:hypothetical protein
MQTSQYDISKESKPDKGPQIHGRQVIINQTDLRTQSFIHRNTALGRYIQYKHPNYDVEYTLKK